jgi:hypothetical protein
LTEELEEIEVLECDFCDKEYNHEQITIFDLPDPHFGVILLSICEDCFEGKFRVAINKRKMKGFKQMHDEIMESTEVEEEEENEEVFEEEKKRRLNSLPSIPTHNNDMLRFYT